MKIVRLLRIVLLILLILIILVAVGGFALYWDTTRSPLPQISGDLRVAGLDAPVEVLRDSYGIPNLYASTLHDLYFAQGFVQAQDRWWQMEFNRHIGRGAIEELTGRNAAAFSNDVAIRTFGWLRSAERDYAAMNDESRAMLAAFTDGVNAYISSRRADDLALEYRLLGVTGVTIPINPWTPVDTVVWGKVMAWNLTGSDLGIELERARLLDALGADMLADLQPAWPYGERPTILANEDLPLSADTLTAAIAPEQAPSRTATALTPQTIAGGLRASDVPHMLAAYGYSGGGAAAGVGSNNWVAAGSMTVSGQPLLANDPHLGFGMPSIWYQIGLHCQPVTEACPLSVSGFTFPSSPGVIIGHNSRIAWGVTNTGADVLDVYRIEVNPENPLQYRWEGDWRDMTLHEEIIRFGDGEPSVTVQVRETHLGPIINDNDIADDGSLSGFNNTDPLAMRWAAYETGTLLDSIRRLNLATDWNSFRDALSYWDMPSQNFVYADVEGNIGYQTPGRIPYRAADHDPTLPADGTTAAHEWGGYIPFDLLPRIFNPERGYIVTANQAVVPLAYYDEVRAELGDDVNPLLATYWSYGARAERINQLMAELAPHTPATFRQIQADTMNMDAARVLPAFAALDLSNDSTLADARDFLVKWDRRMDANSAAAALWAYVSRELLQAAFDDQLPPDSSGNPTHADIGNLFALSELLDDPENVWWDDATTPEVETRDLILRRALADGLAAAQADLGTDRTAWSWGAVHGLTFVSNPLGASGISLIENMVNRGTYPAAGAYETVNAASYAFSDADDPDGAFPVTAGTSMRLIVDIADFDSTRMAVTTGQSSHPFSPYYSSETDLWRAADHHLMPFTRAAIESATTHRLTLSPP